ncbi:acyl-[acyl-carrier-protein] thioesterase [Nocardia farcinica]|nr:MULTISPECIES: acyl-ACP thioesterase domain-containing protein [Nocardia]AXK87636.1 acyl-[acyl-carrier-protein] thioesterase [Nocardia farcinica]MBA4856738.1 acyl-[acyl-carrier-protein] thioesterase [Nocardia farcinica]MBC9818882.1 acyl-[acyl-carrier-protein] thioesterase [Nocardia farcinica]MBF6072035.1 acyl-[acyl-carrier-protein] thioesterase [Nocardia farcinica]MBF6141516.1 acyl-[acyl-carrier-protein] thioesterase [Nocardia farcinica]
MSLDQPLAPLPEEGMGFVSAWPVRAGDVDPYNRLRFDAVARYLQDIAWEELHQTFLHRSDPNWIVRRTVVDVIRPVLWPDDVRLLRWCSSMSTRWTNMRVRITSGNGGLIETEGFWINISESTGMPARISDEGLSYLAKTTDEHRLRWRPYLTDATPPESDTDLPFPVRATDIDQYNHVNNACYWQAVEQFLVEYPKLVAGPHRAVIEYVAPVLARQHISVRSRYEPGDRTGRPQLRLWFVVGGTTTTVVRIMPLPG